METKPIPEALRRYQLSGKPLFLYNGFLQIRSGEKEPAWNNLERYWLGAMAFHGKYRAITASDIVFAFPPFCTNEGGSARLKELDADEVIGVHADIAAQIRDIPDGRSVKFEIGRWPVAPEEG